MIHRPRAAAIFALFIALSCGQAFAQIKVDRFRQDLAEFSRHASRSIGSDGYYAAAGYLDIDM